MVNPNDTKLSKSINDIMDYMSIMDGFDSQTNSDKSDNTANIYNQSDRNSGTQNFSAKQEILANSHHKKINNSVVLEFKK
jgi:Asp-tRNA(Asn)/Glu-tRNA(Gln) amidotransferase C subunit